MPPDCSSISRLGCRYMRVETSHQSWWCRYRRRSRRQSLLRQEQQRASVTWLGVTDAWVISTMTFGSIIRDGTCSAVTNQITPSGRTVGKLYFGFVKRPNSSGSRSSTLAGVLSLHSSCICSSRPGAFCPPRTEVIPQ